MAQPQFKKSGGGGGPDPGPASAALVRAALTASRALDAFNRSASLAARAAARMAEAPAAPRESSSGPSGGGSSGGGPDTKGAADQAGALGLQLRTAMAPLEGLGGRIAGQINQVGGTITALARQISGLIQKMNFRETIRSIDALQGKLRDGISSASKKAAGDLSLLEKATLKLGPAADKALSAYKGFRQVKQFLGFRGPDVAGKGLQEKSSKVKPPDFGAATAGAGKLGAAVGRISPIAAQAAVSVKGIGVQVAAAFGLVGVVYKLTNAVTDFVGRGIKGAIDLNETLSKTKEVFGANTDSVVANANKMAKSFGLPKGAILDAASSFGLIFNGAKISAGTTAELSNKLTQLAADASSFYNVPLADALEKIQAGLVGESKPLRDFGVLMNEDATKAEAMRLGLVKGRGELSETAKVTARASLITKGLATASGDLARTQGAAANQFRQAGGGLDNFATAMGQVLLPAITSGIGAFNELLGTVVEVFETNKPLIDGWGASIKSAVDSVGAVLRNLGTYWEIAQLKAMEFAINTLSYVDTIPKNLALLADYMRDNWKVVIADQLAEVGQGFVNLGKNIANFATAVAGFLKDPSRGFDFKWTHFADGFKKAAAELPELIKPALVSLQGEIDGKLAGIAAREKKRADAIAAAASKKVEAKPAADTALRGNGGQFAEAAEAGSKEAYTAILRFQGKGGDGPMKDLAATAKTSLEVQREQLQLFQRAPLFSGNAGAGQVVPFTF